MKKILGIIILIIVIVLIAFSFNKKSDKTASTSQEPVKIGGAFLLTGPAALVGEVQRNAVVLAVENINKAGGIKGRPLELVIEDAGYDPKTAVNAYQALKQRGLHLFIMDGSPVVAATRKLVVDDGNFTIAGAATAPTYYDDNNRTCRIAITSRGFGPGMVELMKKNNYKSAALLLPDNEYGRGLADQFTKAFTAVNGKVVIAEFYSTAPGTSDYRTQITKIKAVQSTADALVFSNVLGSVEPMLTQLKELGVNKPIITDNPTLENPALKNLTLANGAEYVDYDYSRTDFPTDSQMTKDFKVAYRTRYNTDPIYFGAASYDITMLIAKAVGEVGEDPQKVADYISNLKNYSGVTGTYSFDKDCEIERELIFSSVKDGKIIQGR